MQRGRSFDIAVAGCGPAGLAAALFLARAGHRVTIFERFERPAPVGSGLILQPTGLSVLGALGLSEPIAALGARIDRLFGRAQPSGRIVLDVRYQALGGARFGIAVHRAALFQTLFEAAARQGLALETGRAVEASEWLSGGRRRLRLAGGRTAGPFDLVVDALGARSPLAPSSGRALAYGALWANLDWSDERPFDGHTLEQRYRRASRMVGVLPIGRMPGDPTAKLAFFWSLKGADYPTWRQGGLDAWKADVAALWPEAAALVAALDHPDRLTMAHYAHRTLATPAATGLVHIGDSFHSTSPQLGQGANMALLDAAALARALEGQPDLDAALRRFVRLRHAHVRLYQAMSWLFTPVYQSDSRLLPIVRDLLIGPLAKITPASRFLAAIVTGLIGDPLGRLGIEEVEPHILPKPTSVAAQPRGMWSHQPVSLIE